MNLNELPDMSDALRQVYEKKKLDPVGKEDGDVDNDGDKDSSDKYLLNRRKAISKAIKKEEVEQVDENRAAARAAGGYKDDSKKQPDPSKKGFTGIGNMSIDQIRKMSARIEKEKTKKEEVEVEEGYKGKHGQSDKEYAASRSQGGKMISGDDKRSGAEYTHGRRVKAANPGMQPDVGGKTKPKSQGKMDKGTRADLMYRKANLKKEEVEAVDEAVYGGTPKKTEDKRMTVTNADKKANTPAYQKFKAGDKRYKAADHMKEHHQKDENGNTIPHPIKEAFYFSDEEIADMVEIDEATDQELIDFFVEAIEELAVDEEDLLEICEHLEGVEVITEVSDKYYDSAVKSSKAAAKKAGPSRVERMKSAAKKAGSMVKAGVKSAGKKAAQTAGKVAGEFSAAKAKQKAKAMARPEKKEAPKSSSSDDDDGTGGKLDSLLAKTRGTSSSDSSSGGGGSAPKKKGILRRIGGAIKRGLKKAIGKTSRVVSKGSDKLAKRMGEEYDRIAHLHESGLFTIQEIESIIEEGYKPIDKKKETAMYRRAGNLSRDALSKGLSTKAGSKAQDKSGKIVSAISSQKERERFSKMADIKARSNYGG